MVKVEERGDLRGKNKRTRLEKTPMFFLVVVIRQRIQTQMGVSYVIAKNANAETEKKEQKRETTQIANQPVCKKAK
jgi:hypothetical protein